MDKIIHYCWFGGKPMPGHALKTLDSWRRFAPTYGLRRWDEETFDVAACPWVADAYEAGKFAFVADYVRFWALYHYGGVYMDLGSLLIRDIESLLEQNVPLSAIERETGTVNCGLIMACEPGDVVVGEVLQTYDGLNYVDTLEFRRDHTVNEMFTACFEKAGFKRNRQTQTVRGWTLLESDCFCPNFTLGGYRIKKNTYSTHVYTGSWGTPVSKARHRIEWAVTPYVGHRPAQVIGRIGAEFEINGPARGLKNIVVLIGKRLSPQGRRDVQAARGKR